MQQVERFLSRRKKDSFGLTVFGRDKVRWAPLTREPDVINKAKPFLRPSRLSREFSGGTDIAGALKDAARTLTDRGAPDNLIILITDGEDNLTDGAGGRMSLAVARALAASWREARIKVCVVIVGADTVPDRLQLIADETQGLAATATHPEALEGAFSRIDALRRFTPKETTEPVPFTRPFAVAGVALLGAWVACLFGLRYTPW
jgi:hypothetical protein